mmetsp:Transcript_24261/g.68266  ORF Transcript_24261/g.68266 Transcript_24261/m.68266 type:complete len:222 (-) Transcript_24261:334-999(-)
MITVFEQIFTCDFVIPIIIQFPKSAIQDVEMFVGKVPCDLVDVFFFIHQLECFQQIRSSDLSRCDPAGMASIDGVEDAGYDCHGVLFLELCVVCQEFESRMITQQSLDEWQKIITDDIVVMRLLDQTKESLRCIVRLHLIVPVPFQHLGCDDHVGRLRLLLLISRRWCIAATIVGGIPTIQNPFVQRLVEEGRETTNLLGDANEILQRQVRLGGCRLIGRS